METSDVGRRARCLLVSAAAGLLALAVLTAAATAADPALTETEIEMVHPVTVLADNPCTGEPVMLQAICSFGSTSRSTPRT